MASLQCTGQKKILTNIHPRLSSTHIDTRRQAQSKCDVQVLTASNSATGVGICHSESEK
jgi:hypothetical protein